MTMLNFAIFQSFLLYAEVSLHGEYVEPLKLGFVVIHCWVEVVLILYFQVWILAFSPLLPTAVTDPGFFPEEGAPTPKNPII